MNHTDVSRRAMIGALGAGAALSAFKPALAAKGPNDQIVMGMIGVGSQGTGRLKEFLEHSDVRIAAICDLDESHRDQAIALVEKTKGYKPQSIEDFRKLLEIKEIDAVTVVTPDHWHSIPTISAFEAGKDVFVEKPLSYSVAEGRAMADASLNYQRVTQMGNHIHNTGDNYRRVVEIVRSGKLGKITRVHLWRTSRTSNFPVRNPATLPAGFNYDFWLGPAPKHEYEPLRSHGTFRQFWDYSGGTFIDFWAHIGDLAFWALDLKAPTHISSVGGRFFLTDNTEASDNQEAILEFPGLLYIYSFRPAPLPGFEHMGDIGALFEGTEASLVANYKHREIWAKGKKVEDFTPPDPSIPDSPGHIREFLDAVKSRNLATSCNIRYGHHLTKFGLLSNIAYRTGQRLEWNDEQEKIVNDRGANEYLSRHMRKPWSLKTQPRPAMVPPPPQTGQPA